MVSHDPPSAGWLLNPGCLSILVASYLETDAQKRLDLLSQAEELILADWPWLFLASTKEGMLVKPYVKNFDPTPMDDDSAGGSQVPWHAVEIVPASAEQE